MPQQRQINIPRITWTAPRQCPIMHACSEASRGMILLLLLLLLT
jgi:hypothetical protein